MKIIAGIRRSTLERRGGAANGSSGTKTGTDPVAPALGNTAGQTMYWSGKFRAKVEIGAIILLPTEAKMRFSIPIQTTLFCLVLSMGALGAMSAHPAGADTLKPSPSVDKKKLAQSKKLAADFRAGKLKKAEAQQFEAAVKRGKSRARPAAAGSLASGANAGSCFCTATCQTIVFANGTEYEFTGTGTVSSPSACADAAEEFCGGAYSTWLKSWNCK